MNPFFQLPNENPLTCHVMCLPNAPSNAFYSLSHFAQKIRNLCWMLKSTGNTVHYYGFDSCEVECDEKVIVADENILMEAYPRCKSEFGHVDINEELDNPDGVDYLEKRWTLETGYALRQRYKQDDFFFWMLPMCGQRHLYRELKDLPVRHVEPGIGYIGAFLPYKVFQSSYIRDFHYGAYHANKKWHGILGEKNQNERPHGSHFQHTYVDWEETPTLQDAVIPNAYDRSLFEFKIEKQAYLLYLGRILRGKGVAQAVEVAERVGMKLIVAGPGDYAFAVGKDPGANVDVIGPVGVEKRKELLSNAKAVLSLSHIDETFGGVAIEAMLSGSVPIVSNSGGFLDTIRNGSNGYRVNYRDIEHVEKAIRDLDKIDPYILRQSGLHFSRERCAIRHNAYLQNIDRRLKFGDKTPLLTEADVIYNDGTAYPADWMIPVDAEQTEHVSTKSLPEIPPNIHEDQL